MMTAREETGLGPSHHRWRDQREFFDTPPHQAEFSSAQAPDRLRSNSSPSERPRKDG